MQRVFFLILGLFLIIGCIYIFLQKPVVSNYPNPEFIKSVRVGDFKINVEIAMSSEERARGLAGRESLASSTGMLFIFGKPLKEGFWMRGMLFPLDIIWIDSKGLVTDIAHSISPDTYPHIFYPSREADYVLEINAGEAAMFGIDIGSQIFFDTQST